MAPYESAGCVRWSQHIILEITTQPRSLHQGRHLLRTVNPRSERAAVEVSLFIAVVGAHLVVDQGPAGSEAGRGLGRVLVLGVVGPVDEGVVRLVEGARVGAHEGVVGGLVELVLPQARVECEDLLQDRVRVPVELYVAVAGHISHPHGCVGAVETIGANGDVDGARGSQEHKDGLVALES